MSHEFDKVEEENGDGSCDDGKFGCVEVKQLSVVGGLGVLVLLCWLVSLL